MLRGRAERRGRRNWLGQFAEVSCSREGILRGISSRMFCTLVSSCDGKAAEGPESWGIGREQGGGGDGGRHRGLQVGLCDLGEIP